MACVALYLALHETASLPTELVHPKVLVLKDLKAWRFSLALGPAKHLGWRSCSHVTLMSFFRLPGREAFASERRCQSRSTAMLIEGCSGVFDSGTGCPSDLNYLAMARCLYSSWN
jgi:hypothetical protein